MGIKKLSAALIALTAALSLTACSASTPGLADEARTTFLTSLDVETEADLPSGTLPLNQISEWTDTAAGEVTVTVDGDDSISYDTLDRIAQTIAYADTDVDQLETVKVKLSDGVASARQAVN